MSRLVRWMAVGILALGVFVVFSSSAVPAVSVAQAAPKWMPVVPQSDADQQCLACHSQPDQIKQLPSGEQLYLTIDADGYHNSLHGQSGQVHCTSCHTNITGFPHPDLAAQNLREVAATFSESCQACHAEQAQKNQDSVHARARAAGNENAAVCSDCHNPHYTSKPDEPRSKIPATCAKCHSKIAEEYRSSVHGQALINDNNPDVPSCIDCHGVHNIQSPTTAQFLLGSPELCASCHTDAQKMAKYGLNTNVLNSYISDFHGTTVTLFEPRSPDQLPNKPLCIDCHGTHNILSTKNEQSTVFKQNLLSTCQRCHPTATTNFSDAWLSHYEPSPTKYPLVYFVNVFYRILIPLVIGGMAIFVATDIVRRLIDRRKGGAQ
jgi:predicted CXXCH cytochrome family protein